MSDTTRRMCANYIVRCNEKKVHCSVNTMCDVYASFQVHEFFQHNPGRIRARRFKRVPYNTMWRWLREMGYRSKEAYRSTDVKSRWFCGVPAPRACPRRCSEADTP